MSALPPGVAYLWLHFALVGAVCGFFTLYWNHSLSLALLWATAISLAMLVLNASLSAAAGAFIDGEVGNRSWLMAGVRGMASIVYLLPFMVSRLVFAPLVCAMSYAFLRITVLAIGFAPLNGQINARGAVFSLSVLFFFLSLTAIGFAQFAVFLRHRAF